jgi:uncharacterized protein (TIGR02453 family)
MITTEIYTFLEQLAENNNKAWFDSNRTRYDIVRADFIDFVAATIQELGSRMNLSSLDPKKCLFRINRDVRFSKNKDPYKLNFSCMISPEGKGALMPDGIYIHIQPGGSFVGMGLYEIEPGKLRAVRQEIDYNLERWKKIINDKTFVAFFGEVQGERLKTNPKGYEAQNPAIEWLRMKQFYVGHSPSNKQTLAEDFPQYIGKVYDAATPFRQFLADAIATA